LPPVLTQDLVERFAAARRTGAATLRCSLDLGRSEVDVELADGHFVWNERCYALPKRLRPRTVYYWDGAGFEPAARYAGALIKLVPTPWGPPTFEIDGIKMLPTARVSPFADAGHKVALIEPRGKRVLDTCGGLGYFAAWCLAGAARCVLSYEKNPDVLWLRGLNPWSPAASDVLLVRLGDITAGIAALETGSIDAVLHDPPRFGIAGELYSLAFYRELHRVLKPRSRLFHYTGTPNKLTSGRDVPLEVATRLRQVGFAAARHGDGILAIKE